MQRVHGDGRAGRWQRATAFAHAGNAPQHDCAPAFSDRFNPRSISVITKMLK
jgi:hypothetical protein